MASRFYAFLVAGLLFICGSAACSDSQDDAADMAPANLQAAAKYNIRVHIGLDADAQGVSVRTQNGGMAMIPANMIAGQKYGWVILKGGEQVANGKMLEVGGGVLDDKLQADFTTKLGYESGPLELALLILLASPDILDAPHPGDLAAFSLFPPSADDPPLTGTSVRVSIRGEDAMVGLNNFYFIRL